MSESHTLGDELMLTSLGISPGAKCNDESTINSSFDSANKSVNGTKSKSLKHMKELLTCPVCQDTFKDPSITPCGHVFCYTCISTCVEKFASCPIDRKELCRDNLAPAPYIITSMITDIFVCCEQCGDEMPMKFLSAHQQSECPERLVDCHNPDCVQKVKANAFGQPCTHYLCNCGSVQLASSRDDIHRCKYVMTTCCFCRGCFSTLLFEKHIGKCSMSIISCPGKKFGCDWSGQVMHMKRHTLKCMFAMLSTEVKKRDSIIGQLQNTIQSQEKSLADVKNTTRKLSKRTRAFSKKSQAPAPSEMSSPSLSSFFNSSTNNGGFTFSMPGVPFDSQLDSANVQTDSNMHETNLGGLAATMSAFSIDNEHRDAGILAGNLNHNSRLHELERHLLETSTLQSQFAAFASQEISFLRNENAKLNEEMFATRIMCNNMKAQIGSLIEHHQLQVKERQRQHQDGQPQSQARSSAVVKL